MLATALGNHKFVNILLSAGADPWRLTKRHKTYALWLAAKYKNIEIMRSLMGIGPNHESQAFRITIKLTEQKALLWRNGKIELVTPISSGTRSHPTPRGRYLITNKYRYWKSTLYPAEMPFFLRLSCGDFGLHMGDCLAIPPRMAASAYLRDPQEGFMPQCQSGRSSKSSKEPLVLAMEVSEEQALLNKNGSGSEGSGAGGEDSLLERENRRWQRSIPSSKHGPCHRRVRRGGPPKAHSVRAGQYPSISVRSARFSGSSRNMRACVTSDFGARWRPTASTRKAA
jgi:L,D-transpeptidase catalytic domain